MKKIQLLNRLQITYVLTLMAVLMLPSMWLLDVLFGVFSDDPSVAKYLVTSAIVLPIIICIGLVFDVVRFSFPSLFEKKRKVEIKPVDRIVDKSSSAESDA